MSRSEEPNVIILPENYTRMMGRGAQGSNIAAAKAVAETVRTTLGPKGMDKMLVDSTGDIVVTNDGVTILEELEIDNPAAKMVVDIARTQEEEVGDGTTTAVVLAGEFLKKSEELLDQNIHPTIIAKGYKLAGAKAEKILKNIEEKVTIKDTNTLKDVVQTAMTGKSSESDKEQLADLIVSAVTSVAEEDGKSLSIDTADIKVEKKTGGSVSDSELINGIVLDKERVHQDMPKKVKESKILLLSDALEVKETERSTEIQINTPDQLKAFLDEEEAQLRQAVDKIVDSGANVVFCQKGIDDIAQYLLAKKGIFAARRLKKSDMQKLAKATGGKIISNLDDVSDSDLGYAGKVYEDKIAGEEMIFVKDCKSPKAVTILVRGGTEHIVDEIERAVQDSLGDLKAVIEEGTVVYGAGSPEIELSRGLLRYSESLKGREQLAVKKYAEALEIIPKTLAENAGLDPIDVLTELKSQHDKKKKFYGIDVFSGKSQNMKKLGVVEPSKVKRQAIKSATEVAIMILRIDDVMTAKRLKRGNSGGHGGPGGMPSRGGMPPGMGGGMPPGMM